jgi:hypothetical protein
MIIFARLRAEQPSLNPDTENNSGDYADHQAGKLPPVETVH